MAIKSNKKFEMKKAERRRMQFRAYRWIHNDRFLALVNRVARRKSF